MENQNRGEDPNRVDQPPSSIPPTGRGHPGVCVEPLRPDDGGCATLLDATVPPPLFSFVFEFDRVVWKGKLVQLKNTNAGLSHCTFNAVGQLAGTDDSPDWSGQRARVARLFQDPEFGSRLVFYFFCTSVSPCVCLQASHGLGHTLDALAFLCYTTWRADVCTRRVPAPVSARSMVSQFQKEVYSQEEESLLTNKFENLPRDLDPFQKPSSNVRGERTHGCQAALIACLQARGDDTDKGIRRGVCARWQQQGHRPARWPRDVPGDYQSAEPAASSGCVGARC